MDGLRLLLKALQALPESELVEAINQCKLAIHEISPFREEPVDCVLWVSADSVTANDYNPNTVAPPEMKLLETSIIQDGYTQPIVAFKTDVGYEVIDGFHRNRVGKESDAVRSRLMGYLPVTIINECRTNKPDRMASTIRHNRARGKHQVTAMSEIIVDLARRNWSDEKIAKELGMEPDEVLRLKQISGLAEMFADREFSQAWEIEDEVDAENMNGSK
jgi:ParB-like chromosome segregation protein Spo0J